MNNCSEESEIVLTFEEKAQLFLMDFEKALFDKCPTCHQIRRKDWSPNEWGAKLTQFVKLAQEAKGEAQSG